jgi:hypothetical protein
MTVVKPLHREDSGTRTATLRQGDHTVEVLLRPGSSELDPGSTIRVEILSRLRGTELIGSATAGDRTVEVSIQDNGRERVRRSYAAPRLTDVELLDRAIEGSSPDPVAMDALAMALALLRGPSGRTK